MKHEQVKLATLVVATAVVTTLISSAAQAQTRYVDDDAPLLGDGLSWNSAYRFLQDALFEASGNPGITEILVAQGTYTPDQDEGGNVTPGDRAADFALASGLALRGGFRGAFDGSGRSPDDRKLDQFVTTLSGDLAGNDGPDFANYDENSFTVVTATSTDETAILEGFTITAANGTSGGGMRNVDASPLVSDCTFTVNLVQGEDDPVPIGGRGGAMHNGEGSSPTVTDCLFSGNAAIGPSRFEPGQGGGIFNAANSATTTIGCTFTRNAADGSGGAMYNATDSSTTVTDCTISSNEAEFGAGIYNDFEASPLVANCVFVANVADLGGGAVYNVRSAATLVNCTFCSNSAGVLGGALFDDDFSSPTLDNCIMRTNAPDQIFDLVSVADATYSNIEGGWPGTGNIDLDPLFVNPDGPDGIPGTADDDLRISPGSPCIDAGDNATVPASLATDMSGNPRFIDDPDTLDTGNGARPIVDMGAFELQELPCLADIDNDGVVDAVDVQLLRYVFGTADPDADVNYDGIVNVLDLIDQLLQFGLSCGDRPRTGRSRGGGPGFSGSGFQLWSLHP